MTTHKMADGPITMTVASVVEMEGKFGKQFMFTSDTGTSVYISEKATEQQFARNRFTFENVVGRRLTFLQVQKDDKKFTNIIPALPDTLSVGPSLNGPAAQAAHSIGAPAAAPRFTLEQRTAFYSRCVDAAITVLGSKCEAVEIPLDARAIQAAAYTLYAGGIEVGE